VPEKNTSSSRRDSATSAGTSAVTMRSSTLCRPSGSRRAVKDPLDVLGPEAGQPAEHLRRHGVDIDQTAVVEVSRQVRAPDTKQTYPSRRVSRSSMR
jgi:hypothetical protein